MSKKQIDKLMHTLLVISGILILIGAFFKLEHWAYGNQILWTGFWSSFVLSGIEINRLKKIIKKLEKEALESK